MDALGAIPFRPVVLAVLLSQALGGPAQVPEAPCLQNQGPAACQRCHPGEGQERWERHWPRPGAAFCLGCHAAADMARHHPTGVKLSSAPHQPMHLGDGGKVVCGTCHDLSRPRFDHRRWRSESLYDRLFRRKPRYKTYFLAFRNDRGQLCLACH